MFMGKREKFRDLNFSDTGSGTTKKVVGTTIFNHISGQNLIKVIFFGRKPCIILFDLWFTS